MKIKVKAPFFDAKGIHKPGEIMEVEDFNPVYHEPVVDEKKATEKKVEKAVEAAPKKTTRKKG